MSFRRAYLNLRFMKLGDTYCNLGNHFFKKSALAVFKDLRNIPFSKVFYGNTDGFIKDF